MGNVIAICDPFTGAVPDKYTNDAYGRRDCLSCDSSYNPMGFTGQYTDEESDLVYMRARYYDPATQQFISRDPLEGATNQPYTYAGDNPVNFIDRTGMAPEKPWPTKPMWGEGEMPTIILAEEFGPLGMAAGLAAEAIGGEGASTVGMAAGAVSEEEALTNLFKEARLQGITIQADEEATAYLNWRQATRGDSEEINAVNFGDLILVRPEYARNLRVLREEMIHAYQQRLGIDSAGTFAGEIDARLLMIRYRQSWGITNNDVRSMIAEVRQMRRTGRY